MMRLDKDIRRAMDARLSGLTACEERRADIRRRIAREGEKPMKRKMTAGMAIALALMLACAAALAAGLGLFGQLGERENTDARLSALDGVAAQVNQTTVTEDGVTAVIRQAYYDGSRLFVSYELSGALSAVEMGEGWPKDAAWTNEQPGVIFRAIEGFAREHRFRQSGGMWGSVLFVDCSDGVRRHFYDTYMRIE